MCTNLYIFLVLLLHAFTLLILDLLALLVLLQTNPKEEGCGHMHNKSRKNAIEAMDALSSGYIKQRAQSICLGNTSCGTLLIGALKKYNF